MSWILFAFLSAFFDSVKNVLSKKCLQKIDEHIVVWSYSFSTVFFLAPFLFFVEIPPLENKFWGALFIGGCLNLLAGILYMRAIKSSGLSKTIPLTCFAPVFVVITSPIVLGEHSKLFDVVGVLTIVTGAYILNNNQVNGGYLAPLKSILNEEGSQLMLCVTFLWGISSAVDKIGVQSSSPFFWTLAIYTFITLATFPITLCRYRSIIEIKQIGRSFIFLVLIGLLVTLAEIFQMKAINLTVVSRVEALKLINVLMTILFGYMIFKEKIIKKRLVGTAIMIVGVLFITLSN
jgi:uncharacterized membrane protein